MSKITKKAVSGFLRLLKDAPRASLQGAFADNHGGLCACDGFMLVCFRGGASAPELSDVPRAAVDPVHGKLLDMYQAAAHSDARLAGSTSHADYHGENMPVFDVRELRAFSRWSCAEYGGDAFSVGAAFVAADRLARMLDMIPDARIYAQDSPLLPLYITGAHADGILLPVRVKDPAGARARMEEYQRQQTQSASTPASGPIVAPPAGFVPASILDAVQNTPETSLRVIGYKSDGNTVCVHRVRAHHIADNVYVYADKPDAYGYFVWWFVSLFDCGFALKLDCKQDNIRNQQEPDAPANMTTFHCCKDFADDGADYTLVDYVRMANAPFANNAAFISCITESMRAGRPVMLSYVRLLQEMGAQDALVDRVMEYREQREKARAQAEAAREAERLEAERREEEERKQQHAQALADCCATLLSEGERMPIDGALLCELAASLGVSVSLKLKGWIINKLATVTIENGHMVMYQYNRQKKSEKGSNAFWPFMQSLLDNLRNQEQHSQAEEASEADLDHLFVREHTPKLENQGENLENDAYKRLLGLSSGTVSTLMREKGLQDCDKYAVIDTFHYAIILAAQSLAPVEDETWQQLFERAYSALYPSTQHEEQEQPIGQSETTNTQESAQDNTQDTSAQHAPKLENQPQNPSSDGHTLPDTWTRMEQLTIQKLLNTS